MASRTSIGPPNAHNPLIRDVVAKSKHRCASCTLWAEANKDRGLEARCRMPEVAWVTESDPERCSFTAEGKSGNDTWLENWRRQDAIQEGR